MKYMVSGVVKGRREEIKLNAVSKKQAWFFFCKTYGYQIRDFKVLPIIEISNTQQLSFL